MEEDSPTEETILSQHCPAAPADRIAFVVALPAELGTSSPVDPSLVTVEPTFNRDEAEAAGTVVTEFDGGGLDEVQGVTVPEVHLLDSPAPRYLHVGNLMVATHPAETSAIPRHRAPEVRNRRSLP
jgi:hypothetical protein